MKSIEQQVIRKLYWRLIPFILAAYIVAYLDRTNVGFAALQMNADLGLSKKMFAFGGGIFFIGYLIFEIPSNWFVVKVGARRWIARIMISWGLVSAATMFVTNPTSFYVLRFLLGVAEAGFFPGMILYMTRWFPLRHRSRVMGMLLLGVPLSFIIGSPISGYIMSLPDMFGLRMWQLLFVIEAIPSVVLGLVCIFYLPDTPKQARWLSDEQRQWLADTLAAEAVASQRAPGSTHGSFSSALLTRKVWGFGFCYLGINFGVYGLSLWLPQIVSQFGFGSAKVGMLTTLPYIAAAAFIVVWSRHADRTSERRWHAIVPCVLGAVGLASAGLTHQPAIVLGAFAIATAGVLTALPSMWSVATLTLSGEAAAGGIAMINSIGQLGGFGGPYQVGVITELTGSFGAAMLSLSCWLVVAAFVLFAMTARHRDRSPAQPVSAGLEA